MWALSGCFPKYTDYIQDFINHESNRYNTIDYEKPNDRYIILEIIGKENNKKGLSIYYRFAYIKIWY